MNEAIQAEPVRASRIRIWLLTLTTVVLAPLINFGIGLATGFDPSSFALYTFIPIGGFALCAVACSGFIFGVRTSTYSPDTVDLVFLIIASVSTIVLTFAVEYVYYIQYQGITAEQLGGFKHFVARSITEAQYTMDSPFDRGHTDHTPIRAGESGYLIMAVKFFGAAAIGKIVHSSMVSHAINRS